MLAKRVDGKKNISAALIPDTPPPVWRAAQPVLRSDVCQSSPSPERQTSAG